MHHQRARMNNFSVLPEGCISHILSMTSPRDASRLSATSSLFNAAANSDSVWEKFLPSDYQQIISRSSASPPVGFSTKSKKQLYFSLCDSPLLLDGGKLSFGVDRESGKKCYTLPAQELKIAFKTDNQKSRWIMLPESRFSKVAQLKDVRGLSIRGRINTEMLSTNTNYAAYLIFKTGHGLFGLESPVKSSVEFVNKLEDGYEDRLRCTVFFNLETFMTSWPRVQNARLPKMRRDGWMEVELGEFYNDEGDEGEVEMRLRDLMSQKSSGLIVEGIEVRPKAEPHVPVPCCSCTGVPRSCYKWGGGGWQSACCTATMSVYPLPQIPNKRHARVGGRKMRGTVFTKLLTRLRAVGHDLSIPLDLKDYWAKHGCPINENGSQWRY